MEGDAGASRLNPTGPEREDPAADGAPDTEDAQATEEQVVPEASEPAETVADDDAVVESADGAAETAEVPAGTVPSEPSRIGRNWLIAIAAVLLVLAAGVGTAGYFALRAGDEGTDLTAAETAAVAAAKDCVAATQAPDTASMAASQQKMVDCATGDYAVQAQLYSSVMVEAYQAADIKVKVTDMRAAVERHNDDGSLNVLVAFRMEVTNTAVANQETGMRLRVKMAPVDGSYRIAKLDQVAS